MSTKTASAVAEETPKKKVYTNWDAFNKSNLIPSTIVCDVIHGHPADESCKTRLALKGVSFLQHYRMGHGGGFQVILRSIPGKKWPGWAELETAGMEATTLRCEVCDREVQVSPRDILNHLRPHQGKWKNAFQTF